MTKELEERLATLEKELALSKLQIEQKPAKTRQLRRKMKRPTLLWWIAIPLVLVLTGTSVYYFGFRSQAFSTPIPSSTLQAAGFPVYYPSQIPDGYTYVSGSASISSGTIFYKLHNDSKEVLVIQQPSPKTNLMLDSTVGLDPIDTPNGKAYVGKSKAQPVAILQTKTTLINISGSSDVSDDVINSLARSLRTASN